ncbi:LOW QUALITY PROTEIN: P2Y purinoceptor 14-like [Scomber scombrus]|uniref:LOW QUALITY PROTEIN: P2Y purinoceptor 14-like n=1 Tax=Scomber scombrus TaxID=13677 RepID=UPI002DDC5F05|nr:LOW QUALITY PROTEIN: P2Y purinoceptor 14-like [Scomber scombrus]
MEVLGGVRVTPSSSPSPVTNQTAECGQVDTSTHIFFMLVYSLVFLVGLILNGFTLKVYFCQAQQQMSSSVTIYLKNLAAADFLLTLCLPIRISNYASNAVSVRRVYCTFGASAFYLNMYASILFMGYIAANRYLKIVHPLGTHILQTVRAAHIVSMVTWVGLLAMTSTYIVLSIVTHKDRDSVPDTVSCDVMHSDQLRVLYKIIHSISAAIFLAVLISLVFFYYSTSRRLAVAQQKQRASSGSKMLTKSRRNMLVLVSVFCVCFVPYHLVRLPYAFMKKPYLCQAFFYMKELTILLSVFNVCLDPLIYFLFCKAFRSQLNLKRVFNTTHVATCAEKTEQKSSEATPSTIKMNRKTSLTPSMRQTNVL